MGVYQKMNDRSGIITDNKAKPSMINKTTLILKEINKVIVGKEDIVSKVLMAILAEGHVLLEDVPGVGKTTLALSLSKVLGLDYKREQFTSDSTPSDIRGFSLYNKERGAFEYKKGANFCRSSTFKKRYLCNGNGI